MAAHIHTWCMGFLHNYLGLEPAYKDRYDLPLLGMMPIALHRDRPGADGFRSGHQGRHFVYHRGPEYCTASGGAVMSRIVLTGAARRRPDANRISTRFAELVMAGPKSLGLTRGSVSATPPAQSATMK